ncbi:MAG: glutamate racemase [Proteobacteria bacterium]|nr:glutamate racemase [Desulfobulbaceae bacterium]MBU4153284.1 glutamate racemase [Pseudomonadota bacterium]
MIGIFDSGVGGMTVAHAVEKALPGYDLVYFGDLARTPYGSKSPETIRRYAQQNIDFLIGKGARLIIIACNSAASVTTEEMLGQYELPIFDVINPAVTRVVEIVRQAGKKMKVGIIGTRATVKSGVYARKIESIVPECRVISQECPLLVPLVEEGWLDKRETKMILRRYLHPLRIHQVDALVLGCTHYPLLKNLVAPRIGKKVRIIDSSEEVSACLREYLLSHPELDRTLSRGGENRFYVSDVTDAAVATAAKIFGRRIDLIRT